jgi:hypothetical protein
MHLNLPAIEAAALKLADRYAYHGRHETARALRHIAADAASAGDDEYPCAASLESVEEWLAWDDELALAAESYVPAIGAA